MIILYLKVNSKMEKEMEKVKNMNMVKFYLKENIKIIKEMEKVKNITGMVKFYSKVNI